LPALINSVSGNKSSAAEHFRRANQSRLTMRCRHFAFRGRSNFFSSSDGANQPPTLRAMPRTVSENRNTTTVRPDANLIEVRRSENSPRFGDRLLAALVNYPLSSDSFSVGAPTIRPAPAWPRAKKKKKQKKKKKRKKKKKKKKKQKKKNTRTIFCITLARFGVRAKLRRTSARIGSCTKPRRTSKRFHPVRSWSSIEIEPRLT